MGVGAIVVGPLCALGPLDVTNNFTTSVSVMVVMNGGEISGSCINTSVIAAVMGVCV